MRGTTISGSSHLGGLAVDLLLAGTKWWMTTRWDHLGGGHGAKIEVLAKVYASPQGVASCLFRTGAGRGGVWGHGTSIPCLSPFLALLPPSPSPQNLLDDSWGSTELPLSKSCSVRGAPAPILGNENAEAIFGDRASVLPHEKLQKHGANPLK